MSSYCVAIITIVVAKTLANQWFNWHWQFLTTQIYSLFEFNCWSYSQKPSKRVCANYQSKLIISACLIYSVGI